CAGTGRARGGRDHRLAPQRQAQAGRRGAADAQPEKVPSVPDAAGLAPARSRRCRTEAQTRPADGAVLMYAFRLPPDAGELEFRDAAKRALARSLPPADIAFVAHNAGI